MFSVASDEIDKFDVVLNDFSLDHMMSVLHGRNGSQGYSFFIGNRGYYFLFYDIWRIWRR